VYLTEEEWGTNGTKIIGADISTLGTRIGAEKDFTLGGFAATETTYTLASTAIFTMSWY